MLDVGVRLLRWGAYFNHTLIHHNAISAAILSITPSATLRYKWWNLKECGLCHLYPTKACIF
jgi:hypothetical protein